MTYVPTNDGRWVSERFVNLAEVIKDYDPQFELRWIPPEHRSDPTDHTRAFCIWDLVANAPAFWAGEDAEPVELLTHLFDIDNKHGNVLSRMNARNAAIQAMKLKEELEDRAAKQEYVDWLMRNQQNYVHLKDKEGKTRLYDDQFRMIR